MIIYNTNIYNNEIVHCQLIKPYGVILFSLLHKQDLYEWLCEFVVYMVWIKKI